MGLEGEVQINEICGERKLGEAGERYTGPGPVFSNSGCLEADCSAKKTHTSTNNQGIITIHINFTWGF